MVSVPLIDVGAQNKPLARELEEAMKRVLDSGRYILGQEVEGFEKEVAAAIDVKHAIGVSSGTDALLVALMALGIGPGDEVICPSFTFFATAGCVSRVGATPVFVDSCPVCFNIDVGKASAKITAKTKAIIPVHLFGQSADMDSVQELAREHGLRVIEDAAQGFGAAYRGRKSGTVGDFGTFSFFPTKNLGAFGDAGMLVTNNDVLAEEARLLRNHGMSPKYHYQRIGGNFRLDELQAALLRVKLPHLPKYEAGRTANAAHYESRLSSLNGVVVADPAGCCCALEEANCEGAAGPQITLPVAYGHNRHVWNQYTIRVHGGKRDTLRDHLAARGIASEVYYPVALHDQACFSGLGMKALSQNHNATVLSSEVLSLPVFPEMTAGQREAVVAGIDTFLQQH